MERDIRKNLEDTFFYGVRKPHPFLSFLRSSGEKPAIFEYRKKRGFESCSNMSSTLAFLKGRPLSGICMGSMIAWLF